MDRVVQRNVLAMSGRAVEAAGDIDMLLLDKTGTITFGNRLAAEFIPVGGAREPSCADRALRSSLADETPEGESIVALAEQLGAARRRRRRCPPAPRSIPFTRRDPHERRAARRPRVR